MGLLDFLFKKSKDSATIKKESTEEPNPVQNYEELTECEQNAIGSRAAFFMGDRGFANDMALEVYKSLIADPNQIHEVKNASIIALALGALMEGEYFTENESIKRAVGLTYYFLCRAISESLSPDPYLYVYRFSLVWEYNKTFYHLLAHADGEEYNPSPFSPLSMISTQTYDHHMMGMQMADVLVEPRVIELDPALRNIFYDMYNQYRSTPSKQIIDLGKKYHEQVYSYLNGKILKNDLNF